MAANSIIFSDPSFDRSILGVSSPLSYQGHQFVAFFDEGAKLSLARRRDGGPWKVLTFVHQLANQDSHRTAELGISGDGRIHVGYNHHVDPLRYIVSTAGAATVADSEFTTALFTSRLGYLNPAQPLANVTYPWFVPVGEGGLAMTWREGFSGDGDLYFATYRNGAWSTKVRLVQGGSGSGTYNGDVNRGSTTRNPYGTLCSHRGVLYYAWMWREQAGSAVNHDLMFMQSSDGGSTWTANDGTPLTLPVRLTTAAARIWSIAESEDLFNAISCSFDRRGDLHLMLRHDENAQVESNRYWHYWRRGGVWNRRILPATLPVGGPPEVVVDAVDDTVYAVVRANNRLQVYASPRLTEEWGQWTQVFTSSNTYMSSGRAYQSDDGRSLWWLGQRASTAASSALEVVRLRLRNAPPPAAITWNAPTYLIQGQPLGASQLNATAPVPGTFTYTPPAGTLLPLGPHRLSVTFTPSNDALQGGGTASATVTVIPPELAAAQTPPTRSYFGSFAGGQGYFGLILYADRTGVFLGYDTAARVALFSRAVTIDPEGRFAVTARAVNAAGGEVALEGVVGADSALRGAIPTLGLSFAAPGTATGATAGLAGWYQAGAAGSSASIQVLLGHSGEALIVTETGGRADGGLGNVSATGALSVTLTTGTALSGRMTEDTLTVSAAGTTYLGSRDSREVRLSNLAARGAIATAADSLIAGFVIGGAVPKPVLVRGIGPTLAALGVAPALGAVRLEIFRGQSSIAVGEDWSASVDGAAAVSAVTARVGAFSLPPGSRDGALALDLAPGSYTAVVTGRSGATGVALVEVYDATVGAIPPSARVVNLATRATAGRGDDALIGGFYISGRTPRRVLIRGVGPGLAAFGVTGALLQPRLTVMAGVSPVAENAGWSNTADAAALATAATQVGAFALSPGSADAAILIHLSPGAYTAVLAGAGGNPGAALLEIYEVH